MASSKKPTKRTQSPTSKPPGKRGIWDAFLLELEGKIDAKESGTNRKITKAQALIKSMINEALKGDARMLAQVLKLIDKLDIAKPEKAPEETPKTLEQDWELLFDFFGRYRPLIEQEIEKRKAKDPTYWSFDWFRPERARAPWQDDITD